MIYDIIFVLGLVEWLFSISFDYFFYIWSFFGYLVVLFAIVTVCSISCCQAMALCNRVVAKDNTIVANGFGYTCSHSFLSSSSRNVILWS